MESTMIKQSRESRRLLEEKTQSYKALEQELRDLEASLKANKQERDDLQRRLETNKKERDKLENLYEQKSKERDKKKDELQYAQTQLGGMQQLQSIGHQVVGSGNASHEDVQMMYNGFFGGESASAKKLLKEQLGSIGAGKVLSQIFQVIFDSVQEMMVGHLLRCALIKEVLQSQKSLQIEDRVRETRVTNDRQQLFKAFKIEEAMTGEQRVQTIKQAITSLFQVTGDAGYQAEMHEKQMAYGILLDSCRLMDMTADAIAKTVEVIKGSLHKSSKFSTVEGFDRARSLAGELLDTYITGGIRLVWMMVTRIPPMIAAEPTAYNAHTTTLEGSNDCDVTSEESISTRPTLYYSYEGQVAVQGIITTRHRWVHAQVLKFNQAIDSPKRPSSQQYQAKTNMDKDKHAQKVAARQSPSQSSKQLREMKAVGHQVVGSGSASHEDVHMMYARFFGGESAHVKKLLKESLGSIRARKMLSQIFQVIFDSVQGLLVQHLKSMLLGGIPQYHKLSVIKGREIEIHEKMIIFQAFKIQKVMTRNEQARLIEQAMAPLFHVSSPSRNAGFQAEMREKQMVYGILLGSCGLLEMTEDAIARTVEAMKCSLHKSSEFSAVEGFDRARSLAGELLNTYITGGIRLAWMMVTRIPPMIAVEPTAFDEHTTVLEGSSDSDVTQKRTISMRPILYYSYESQVAVQGIVTILPTRVPP